MELRDSYMWKELETQVNDQVDIQVWDLIRFPVHDRLRYEENFNENRK